MTPYLFWELLFLGIGVWMLVLIMVIYAWILLQRQRKMIDIIYDKLDRMEKKTSKPTQLLKDLRPALEEEVVISKDEPISKYKDVDLSDAAKVSFVDVPHDE